MINKKLIVGMTSELSIALIPGQLKYFKRLGYETYLMIPKSDAVTNFCKKEECIHLPVHVDREISILKDIKSFFEIIRVINRVKPDIVNLSTAKMGFIGLIAAKLCGVKRRVFTCRGFRHEHEKGILKMVLMFSDYISGACAHKIICISQNVMEKGIIHHVFPKKKCVVINKGSSNGIDLKIFSKKNLDLNKRQTALLELQIEGKFIYGFVGRMNDRKGIKELFEAFEILCKSKNNIKLLLVGPIEEDRFEDKTLVTRMKEHPNVVFTGTQRLENIPLYLSLMDVLVLPTWSEGFGNVLIQAAAMGLPVIGTRGTGAENAVSEGFNGLLVPYKNSIELYVSLRFMLDNPEKRKKFAYNSLIWVKNFDPKIIWDGMNKIYLSSI